MVRFIKYLTVCLSAISLTCCTAKAQNTGDQAMEETKKQEWREIKPVDIDRNAVKMFAKDWMALAMGHKGDMNAMTISWGSLGQLWEMPVVTVYVSASRYSHQLMERSQYFTVTALPKEKKKALVYLGTKSGRDEDKVKNSGLTTEFTELGNPIFSEGNLAIECRILYRQELGLEQLPDSIKSMYDYMKPHTMYIGEILHVWVKD